MRDRDAEFNERQQIPATELRTRLEATLRQADAVLSGLSAKDLLRTYEIQVYRDLAAMDAIYHVAEHFAMHYGQILYVAKMISGKNLGFYRNLSGAANV